MPLNFPLLKVLADRLWTCRDSHRVMTAQGTVGVWRLEILRDMKYRDASRPNDPELYDLMSVSFGLLLYLAHA